MADTASSFYFIGTLVSCILYGMYYVLFGAGLYILCYRRQTRFNSVLLGASILICVLTTMIMALFASMLYEALFLRGPDIDSSLYLEESYFQWKGTLVVTLCITDMIALDAVLVYRGLAVWSYRWPVLAPSLLLWLFTVGFAFFLTFKNATVNLQDYQNILRVSTYSTVWLAASLAQNIVTTLLIAYRLWSVHVDALQHRETRLLGVMWIVVESGALYSASTLAYTIAQGDVGKAMDALQQITIPIGGISFSLIIVRVGLGLTRDSEFPSLSTSVQQTTNVADVVRARSETELSSLEQWSTECRVGSLSYKQSLSEISSSGEDIERAA